ncbi:succinate dehydrogenase, cytochrome b556 subunit [Asaia lannensis]|uniref:Succinate dehydrogenase cytochrome b556 subunit n=1 Tax=Asaia lannensis NBRC 102526 TaxID=1307926 RepID=A0ABT1CD20_9PROT|nr:succinate dehydrogenase, cytochrome b556 subunit [Asaia lannensis]MCO6158762.1 succinate dehydrogenase, cytochrome b556 subunit [Asaia lannensis NBRC 102526]GBR00282.1 succinate dehydrogenase cytochrome b subunit [Asaia lannensis NBRC 102526]
MASDGREAFYYGTDTQGRPIRRPMSPHLDIYRFRLSMALSIGNRISGVVSSLGAGLAVAWLAALAQGPRAFVRAQRVATHPLGRLVFLGWGIATIYHFVASIRHLIWDSGARFEKKEINEDGRRSVFVTAGLSVTLVAAFVALSRSRSKGMRS